ncbi:2258_t:CDS:2 [Ambispora gerdemannii]|uniref:2258_t:CDS:1 n=1 Tax=Ambispora gerdemannii TaxID=144530 RepID=A0A9N8ZZJ0_9GLOM|nr:2258_t:CDS:2 [Ambispora gerdemannii]
MYSNKRVNNHGRSQEVSGNKRQKINSNEYSKRYRDKKKQEFLDLQKKNELLGEKNQELNIEIISLHVKMKNLEKVIYTIISLYNQSNQSIDFSSLDPPYPAFTINENTRPSLDENINTPFILPLALASPPNQEFNILSPINEDTPLSLNQNLNTYFITPLSSISLPNQEINAAFIIDDNTPLSLDQNLNNSFFNTSDSNNFFYNSLT